MAELVYVFPLSKLQSVSESLNGFSPHKITEIPRGEDGIDLYMRSNYPLEDWNGYVVTDGLRNIIRKVIY